MYFITLIIISHTHGNLSLFRVSDVCWRYSSGAQSIPWSWNLPQRGWVLHTAFDSIPIASALTSFSTLSSQKTTETVREMKTLLTSLLSPTQPTKTCADCEVDKPETSAFSSGNSFPPSIHPSLHSSHTVATFVTCLVARVALGRLRVPNSSSTNSSTSVKVTRSSSSRSFRLVLLHVLESLHVFFYM